MTAILSVPAGRAFRRGQTKWVDAQAEKGMLHFRLEDDLLRLVWKNRSTGVSEDELIIFPGEATFDRVYEDPSERTHILKFNSSDQKYFFWFQRPSKDLDDRHRVDINALLQDPHYTPGTFDVIESARTPDRPTRGPDGDWPPTPGAPRLSFPTPGPPIAPARLARMMGAGAGAGSGTEMESPSPAGTPPTSIAPRSPTIGNDVNSSVQSAPASNIQNPSRTTTSANPTAGGSTNPDAQEDMARMLVEWASSGGLANLHSNSSTSDDSTRLHSFFSAANIRALLTRDPGMYEKLKQALPIQVDLPEYPNHELLVEILTAPQMIEAVDSLENALRSGGLPGGMMRDIGLPESAGQGVGPFLHALAALYKGESDEMDED